MTQASTNLPNLPLAAVTGADQASSPSASPTRKPPKPPLWVRLVTSDSWVLILCAVYFGVVSLILPDMASTDNLENILSNMLPLLAVAVGQTLVLVTGGIDLSATSTVALASVAGAAAMTGRFPGLEFLAGGGAGSAIAGILLMLLLGAFIGLGNGALVTRLSLPPFMATLTVMMFLSGFALWATGSKPIFGLPAAFTDLGRGGIGPVPFALLIAAPVAVAVHVWLSRTAGGRYLYAAGMNARAAKISAVPVTRILITAYVGSGVCSALASVLYTARLETGSPVLGQRIFLDVIGAAVIGGTSLFGGKGTVFGTVLGVLFITLIDNSFNLLGFSSFTVLIAKGGVILGAALLDVFRTRLAARS